MAAEIKLKLPELTLRKKIVGLVSIFTIAAFITLLAYVNISYYFPEKSVNVSFLLVPFVVGLFLGCVIFYAYLLGKRNARFRLSIQSSQSDNRLFLSGPVVVFKWLNEPGYPIYYVSQNSHEILGYSPVEFTEDIIYYDKIIHPKDLKKTLELRSSVKNSEIQSFEYRIIDKLGNIHYVHEFSRVAPEENSKERVIQGFIVDATHMWRRDLFIKSIFENSTDGIWIWDNNKTISVNSRMAQLIGCSPDDLQGKSIFDFFPDDYVEYMVEKIRESTVSKSVQVYETHLKTSDHRQIPVMFRVSPILADDGEVIGTFALVHDRTEELRSRSALEEKESLMRDMFQHHSAVMLIIDPELDGLIIEANAAAASFYGYSREQLCKMKIADLNTLSPEEIAQEMKKAKERKSNYFIFRHRRANGEIRDVEVHSSPIITNGKKVLFSIIHDITERIQFQKQLDERTRELMEINSNLEARVAEEISKQRQAEQLLIQQSRMAAMGEMIGAIAHQWRQPLNALAILVQDIEDAWQFQELSDEYIKTIIEKSMKQINFMSSTIDDFRNFFRTSKERVNFGVVQAIRDSLHIFEAQLHNNKILVQMYISGHKADLEYWENHPADIDDILVSGFPNEFKQALLNIIANAKDAILERREKEKENPSVITISVKSDTKCVVIEVSDTGVGIDEKIMSRLFDPYFSTKAVNKGTGLGLYMSKVIIENNMGGRLQAENTDHGALFRIILDRVL